MQVSLKTWSVMGFAVCASVHGQAFGGTPLNSAENFAVLGGTTVTNAGRSVITGDLGVWPGTTAPGFPPGVLIGQFHLGDPVAMQAQADLTTAYNAFAGMAVDEVMTGVDLGGMTLAPGVYFFASSAGLTGTLTLDGLGDPLAVWVFQIGSTLTTSAGSAVVMSNGGVGNNVYWQVGSSATIGANTALQGNVLALASITMEGGATILDGRALARDGAVNLDTNVIQIVTRPATCPWDCGSPSDGIVSTLDLLALLAQWGAPGSCDFDNDGVGTADLLELLANWGPCP